LAPNFLFGFGFSAMLSAGGIEVASEIPELARDLSPPPRKRAGCAWSGSKVFIFVNFPLGGAKKYCAI
jgi:hypothetical protein